MLMSIVMHKSSCAYGLRCPHCGLCAMGWWKKLMTNKTSVCNECGKCVVLSGNGFMNWSRAFALTAALVMPYGVLNALVFLGLNTPFLVIFVMFFPLKKTVEPGRQ